MTPSIQQSVRDLLSATASTTGMEFLRALARETARTLGTDIAFVGRLVDGERVKTLAVFGDGRFLDDFEYQLEGTPCAGVAFQGPCEYLCGVQQAFPLDQLLVDLHVQAYAGIPIAIGGETIGILVALDRKERHSFPDIGAILGLFADRAGAEIQRMDAEAARHAADERYRQIVAHCLEGVWTIDRDANTTYVNDQMAAMLGLTPADMLGRHIFAFIDAEARLAATRALRRREGGVAERIPFRFKHADGSDVWTEMSTAPLTDDEGDYAGAMAMVTDVTERYRLLESMQQKQKLESLGVLAGGVAHDFNNLLVGVLGNAELLAMNETLDARGRRLLDGIQSAALSAAGLTNQLLAYAGRAHISPQDLSVNTLLDEITSLLGTAVSGNIQLTLEVADDLPDIHGDRAQLTQVFMNLVSNAGDAIGEQEGEIVIRTGVTDADSVFAQGTFLGEPLAQGQYVYVQVQDTGCGMAPETLHRIFDPFFSTKFTGHGLGLAAVLGILRRHGGGIAIDSTLGQGSTFTVLLPVAREATGRAAPETGSIEHAATGRILVVDDDPTVRKVSTGMLRASGYETEEAADGDIALEKVRRAPAGYVAILLDLSMPRVGGREVVRALRAEGVTVPIILLSGLRDEGLSVEGIDAFLAKPFQLTTLLQTLRRVLTRRA